jgi:hypothetical protein
MAQVAGAEKGERVEGRLSYRTVISLLTRAGKLELIRRLSNQDGNGNEGIHIVWKLEQNATVSRKSRIPHDFPWTMSGRVWGHPPVVLLQALAQIICPADIDSIWFIERAQYICIAKSPPSPRLRRAAFAPPLSIFISPHKLESGPAR